MKTRLNVKDFKIMHHKKTGKVTINRFISLPCQLSCKICGKTSFRLRMTKH